MNIDEGRDGKRRGKEGRQSSPNIFQTACIKKRGKMQNVSMETIQIYK